MDTALNFQLPSVWEVRFILAHHISINNSIFRRQFGDSLEQDHSRIFSTHLIREYLRYFVSFVHRLLGLDSQS